MEGWQTENPVWMEEREAIWNKFEIRLRDQAFMLGEGKTRLKQWRTYYLTGKLSKNSKLELIDRLWMHARQNEEAWGEICETATVNEYFETIRVLMLRSCDGYMEGIDGPLLKFLLGKDISRGVVRFKDEEIEPKGKALFDWWRRRAFLWLEKPYELEDCFCGHTIDFFFALLPHMPPEYFNIEVVNPSSLHPDRKRMALMHEIIQCHRLFHLISWFVEPRGLKGDDTPVRRFAETMMHEMDTRDIPAHVKELWEYMKSDEARYLDVRDDDAPLSTEFPTVVMHHDAPIENPLTLIRNIHKTFEYLDFTTDPFEAGKVEPVELKKNLSAKFFQILGFEKGNSMPGYRYRIQTSDTFVNSPSQNDSINMDVIVFSHPRDHAFIKDTPVAMLVPRPLKNYDTITSGYSYKFFIYQLNYRLVCRTLAAHHNMVFKEYEKFIGEEYARWSYEAIPHMDVPYFPLKSGPKALLDTPKKDFPILKDSPLPPLA